MTEHKTPISLHLEAKMENSDAIVVVRGLKKGDLLMVPVYQETKTGPVLKELSHWELRIAVRDVANIETWVSENEKT